MHRTTYTATLASLVMCVTVAIAANTNTATVKGPDFEALKKMAGEWQLDDPKGQMNGTVRYQVTSAGTAVVETMAPGTPHEMVTVYTREGHNVAATHYCGMGNQPHLMSKPAAAANQLYLDFVSGGNMKSVKEPHMHSLTLTFVDDNHVKQEWQSYANGKPGDTTVFNLTRKS